MVMVTMLIAVDGDGEGDDDDGAAVYWTCPSLDEVRTVMVEGRPRTESCQVRPVSSHLLILSPQHGTVIRPPRTR